MKYNESKIYKIVCNITGLIYVGSTTEKYLSNRLQKHKSSYKLYLNDKYHYVSSFMILENNNYNIILLENVNCNSKDELIARERYYIETLDCVNRRIEGRKNNEYYKDHQEYLKSKAREYQDKNKETIKEKRNVNIDCACGGKYTLSNQARHFKTKSHIQHISFQNQVQSSEVCLNV